MANVYGRVCCLVIFLIIIYNCNNNCAANEINEHAYYDVSGSYLQHIDTLEPILSADSETGRQRKRREAPQTDAKNEYQSVTQNGSIAGANGSADAVTTLNVAAAAPPAGGAGGAGGSAKSGASVMVDYNVGNVGVNGTGQRKTDTTIQMAGAAAAAASGSTGAAGSADDVKKPNGQQFPKKVGATNSGGQQTASSPTVATASNAAAAAAAASGSVSATADKATDIKTKEEEDAERLIEDIDISEEKVDLEAKQQNYTSKTDHHVYYNSSMTVNKEEANRIWNEVKEIPFNTLLSQSHRRAMTVDLKFDFPFYGHNVRSITIATGGFIYTGEYVHSWLAATQYIAPLMANFDTSISNDSYVRMKDNGTAFTVVWENVVLQDKPNYGKFTFSATLFNTGNVVFTYHSVPILIDTIQDSQHPVKVGLSDAYIIDKYFYFARRKTIYEYHRVTFQQNEIENGTIIYLNALPTCLSYTECSACINHTTSFDCVWCPQINRCSTGTDRKKQEWIQKGCESSPINNASQCPLPGDRGNNATNQTGSNPTSDTDTTQTPGGASAAGQTTVAPIKFTTTGSSAGGASTNNNSDELPVDKSQAGKALDAEHAAAAAGADPHKNVGVAFGFMVPICLVFAVTLWLFYAYRNPHTRSGQLLIQFRPSQWSWRRGEARYTAATIHM